MVATDQGSPGILKSTEVIAPPKSAPHDGTTLGAVASLTRTLMFAAEKSARIPTAPGDSRGARCSLPRRVSPWDGGSFAV